MYKFKKLVSLLQLLLNLEIDSDKWCSQATSKWTKIQLAPLPHFALEDFSGTKTIIYDLIIRLRSES